MHIIRNLPPEALTVIAVALGAAVLLIAFALAPRLRRIKDEGLDWDEPKSFAWGCPECGLYDTVAAATFTEAKTEAWRRHNEILAVVGPDLLDSSHSVLVTQEN